MSSSAPILASKYHLPAVLDFLEFPALETYSIKTIKGIRGTKWEGEMELRGEMGNGFYFYSSFTT